METNKFNKIHKQRSATLQEIGELKLHSLLKTWGGISKFPVKKGIGDDAAVLKFEKKNILLTTDALEESIHFDFRTLSPFLLGARALAVNLSDIAAMGGTPIVALLALSIPSSVPLHQLKEFYKGFLQQAKKFQVQLVGGDLDASPKGWRVNVTLIGETAHPIYRSGAELADEIWVTGELGSSAMGLKLLQQKKKVIQNFKKAHLRPIPRVKEGIALSEKKLAHALIDVSDGLLLDLERLCEASGVGAEIEAELIPRHPSCPLNVALAGGEDYELLFTASSRNAQKIQKIFEKLKTPVHKIGRIVDRKNKVRVLDAQKKPLHFSLKGFRHF